jgi:hypothetical protein
MCKRLAKVSEFIGETKSLERVLPLIQTFLDDPDHEVRRRASASFMRHCLFLFPPTFMQSDQFKSAFLELLKTSTNELTVLKRLGKVIERVGSHIHGIDESLLKMLINCKRTEHGRMLLPEVLSKLPPFCKTSFTSTFFPQLI